MYYSIIMYQGYPCDCGVQYFVSRLPVLGIFGSLVSAYGSADVHGDSSRRSIVFVRFAYINPTLRKPEIPRATNYGNFKGLVLIQVRVGNNTFKENGPNSEIFCGKRLASSTDPCVINVSSSHVQTSDLVAIVARKSDA
jgi:hypothetical protein